MAVATGSCFCLQARQRRLDTTRLRHPETCMRRIRSEAGQGWGGLRHLPECCHLLFSTSLLMPGCEQCVGIAGGPGTALSRTGTNADASCQAASLGWDAVLKIAAPYACAIGPSRPRLYSSSHGVVLGHGAVCEFHASTDCQSDNWRAPNDTETDMALWKALRWLVPPSASPTISRPTCPA